MSGRSSNFGTWSRSIPVTSRLAAAPDGRGARRLRRLASRCRRATTFGLVGESGCGKTTIGRHDRRPRAADAAGRSCSTAATSRDCRCGERRRLHRARQLVFQDPYASLDPRMRVGGDRARAARDPAASGLATSSARRCSELLERGRPAARRGQPLPARVLGRPAPAHRARAGARAQPDADRRRRAGVGARRLDPLAGPEPDARPAAPSRPHLPRHLARPDGGALRLRPASA